MKLFYILYILAACHTPPSHVGASDSEWVEEADYEKYSATVVWGPMLGRGRARARHELCKPEEVPFQIQMHLRVFIFLSERCPFTRQ